MISVHSSPPAQGGRVKFTPPAAPLKTSSIVASPPRLRMPEGLCASVYQHAEAAHAGIGPLLVFHFMPGCIDPGSHHARLAPRYRHAAQERGCGAGSRNCAAEPVSLRTNSMSESPLLFDLPVQPADVAVLAIGIVVALLCAAEFVAGQKHRACLERAAAWPESCGSGARRSSLISGSSVGPSATAVPRAVVGTAVLVVLTVRVVVLLIVRNGIVERKTVMCGDEVHRSEGAPAVAVENIAPTRRDAERDRQRRYRPSRKSRTLSRNLSFHSAQPGGKPPT